MTENAVSRERFESDGWRFRPGSSECAWIAERGERRLFAPGEEELVRLIASRPERPSRGRDQLGRQIRAAATNAPRQMLPGFVTERAGP